MEHCLFVQSHHRQYYIGLIKLDLKLFIKESLVMSHNWSKTSACFGRIGCTTLCSNFLRGDKRFWRARRIRRTRRAIVFIVWGFTAFSSLYFTSSASSRASCTATVWVLTVMISYFVWDLVETWETWLKSCDFVLWKFKLYSDLLSLLSRMSHYKWRIGS